MVPLVLLVLMVLLVPLVLMVLMVPLVLLVLMVPLVPLVLWFTCRDARLTDMTVKSRYLITTII